MFDFNLYSEELLKSAIEHLDEIRDLLINEKPVQAFAASTRMLEDLRKQQTCLTKESGK